MSAKIKKVEPNKAVVLGVDPSLNGAAFVLMKNFKVLNYYFFTDTKKVANDFEDVAIFNNSRGPERLDTIYRFYASLLKHNDIDYVAIEDYAYGAKSNSVFQIGGLGEMLRLMTYQSGIPYRDYEPSKVKKFATGSGNAEKSQMCTEAYIEEFDVRHYGKSGEDLADAFWIAKMINTEIFLHKNSEYLETLKKYRREVFTDVSKAYPIPIINRPFVSKRGG